MTNQYVYSSELYHYGVPRQKWYRRRYQNYDGSLTPEGREHYGVGPARKASGADFEGDKVAVKSSWGSGRSYKHNPQTSNTTNARRRAALEKARETRRRNLEEKKRQAEEQKKKDEETAALKEKYSKNPTDLFAHKELFTTEEINEHVKRFQAEEELYKSAQKERERMQEKIKKGQDTIASLVNWSKTARSVYDEAMELKKRADAAKKEKENQQKEAADKVAAEKQKKVDEQKEKYAKDPEKMSKHLDLFSLDEIANAKKRWDAEKDVKSYKDKERAEREKAALEEKKARYANDPKTLYEHRNLFSYDELEDAYKRFNKAEQIEYLAEADRTASDLIDILVSKAKQKK